MVELPAEHFISLDDCSGSGLALSCVSGAKPVGGRDPAVKCVTTGKDCLTIDGCEKPKDACASLDSINAQLKDRSKFQSKLVEPPTEKFISLDDCTGQGLKLTCSGKSQAKGGKDPIVKCVTTGNDCLVVEGCEPNKDTTCTKESFLAKVAQANPKMFVAVDAQIPFPSKPTDQCVMNANLKCINDDFFAVKEKPIAKCEEDSKGACQLTLSGSCAPVCRKPCGDPKGPECKSATVIPEGAELDPACADKAPIGAKCPFKCASGYKPSCGKPVCDAPCEKISPEPSNTNSEHAKYTFGELKCQKQSCDCVQLQKRLKQVDELLVGECATPEKVPVTCRSGADKSITHTVAVDGKTFDSTHAQCVAIATNPFVQYQFPETSAQATSESVTPAMLQCTRCVLKPEVRGKWLGDCPIGPAPSATCELTCPDMGLTEMVECSGQPQVTADGKVVYYYGAPKKECLSSNCMKELLRHEIESKPVEMKCTDLAAKAVCPATCKLSCKEYFAGNDIEASCAPENNCGWNVPTIDCKAKHCKVDELEVGDRFTDRALTPEVKKLNAMCLCGSGSSVSCDCCKAPGATADGSPCGGKCDLECLDGFELSAKEHTKVAKCTQHSGTCKWTIDINCKEVKCKPPMLRAFTPTEWQQRTDTSPIQGDASAVTQPAATTLTDHDKKLVVSCAGTNPKRKLKVMQWFTEPNVPVASGTVVELTCTKVKGGVEWRLGSNKLPRAKNDRDLEFVPCVYDWCPADQPGLKILGEDINVVATAHLTDVPSFQNLRLENAGLIQLEPDSLQTPKLPVTSPCACDSTNAYCVSGTTAECGSGFLRDKVELVCNLDKAAWEMKKPFARASCPAKKEALTGLGFEFSISPEYFATTAAVPKATIGAVSVTPASPESPVVRTSALHEYRFNCFEATNQQFEGSVSAVCDFSLAKPVFKITHNCEAICHVPCPEGTGVGTIQPAGSAVRSRACGPAVAGYVLTKGVQITERCKMSMFGGQACPLTCKPNHRAECRIASPEFWLGSEKSCDVPCIKRTGAASIADVNAVFDTSLFSCTACKCREDELRALVTKLNHDRKADNLEIQDLTITFDASMNPTTQAQIVCPHGDAKFPVTCTLKNDDPCAVFDTTYAALKQWAAQNCRVCVFVGLKPKECKALHIGKVGANGHDIFPQSECSRTCACASEQKATCLSINDFGVAIQKFETPIQDCPEPGEIKSRVDSICVAPDSTTLGPLQYIPFIPTATSPAKSIKSATSATMPAPKCSRKFLVCCDPRTHKPKTATVGNEMKTCEAMNGLATWNPVESTALVCDAITCDEYQHKGTIATAGNSPDTCDKGQAQRIIQVGCDFDFIAPFVKNVGHAVTSENPEAVFVTTAKDNQVAMACTDPEPVSGRCAKPKTCKPESAGCYATKCDVAKLRAILTDDKKITLGAECSLTPQLDATKKCTLSMTCSSGELPVSGDATCEAAKCLKASHKCVHDFDATHLTQWTVVRPACNRVVQQPSLVCSRDVCNSYCNHPYNTGTRESWQNVCFLFGAEYHQYRKEFYSAPGNAVEQERVHTILVKHELRTRNGYSTMIGSFPLGHSYQYATYLTGTGCPAQICNSHMVRTFLAQEDRVVGSCTSSDKKQLATVHSGNANSNIGNAMAFEFMSKPGAQGPNALAFEVVRGLIAPNCPGTVSFRICLGHSAYVVSKTGVRYTDWRWANYLCTNSEKQLFVRTVQLDQIRKREHSLTDCMWELQIADSGLDTKSRFYVKAKARDLFLAIPKKGSREVVELQPKSDAVLSGNGPRSFTFLNDIGGDKQDTNGNLEFLPPWLRPQTPSLPDHVKTMCEDDANGFTLFDNARACVESFGSGMFAPKSFNDENSCQNDCLNDGDCVAYSMHEGECYPHHEYPDVSLTKRVSGKCYLKWDMYVNRNPLLRTAQGTPRQQGDAPGDLLDYNTFPANLMCSSYFIGDEPEQEVLDFDKGEKSINSVVKRFSYFHQRSGTNDPGGHNQRRLNEEAIRQVNLP